MLRYYEEQGLLRPKRQASGYRIYDDEDERRVASIRMLNNAGLSLDKIRLLLPCVLSDRMEFQPCPEIGALFRREIGVIDQQIHDLTSSRRMLRMYLDGLI